MSQFDISSPVYLNRSIVIAIVDFMLVKIYDYT